MSNNIKNLSQLVEKSIFLRVYFGMLGNTRKIALDDTIQTTDEARQGVRVTTDADVHYLKAQKTLMESEELDAIRSADAAMRNWLKLKCLPYTDVGLMVLPLELLDTVETKLSNYEKIERPALVRTFIDAYPHLLEESKAKLGSLYNPDDYLPVEAVGRAFGFEYNVFSFAVPEFLKQTRYYEDAQRKLQEKFHAAAEEITVIMRQTLLDLVTNLQHQLTPAETDGKRKRLTASSVEKVQEFLSTFSARNITNDAELDAVVSEARALVGDVSIDKLRKSDEFKAQMLTGMDGLRAKLEALMVDSSPDRKMRI